MAETDDVQGCLEPRIWTPNLVELTPETSLGFKFNAFCRDLLGRPNDPWQEWLSIHALELRPDGRFRYRTILLLVARQNGKTEWVKKLIVWLLFTGRIHLAVGSAHKLGMSRRTWEEACDLVQATPELVALRAGMPRKQMGLEALRSTHGNEYTIAASTKDAARGIPGCDFLHMDELRTHVDFEAWSALTKTQMARPNALCVATSNAGDDTSMVLNALHGTALTGTDPTLFLAEYSAPDGCRLDSVEAARQANPSLGRGRLSMDAITAARALDPPAVFRTEVLCQRVMALDSAVDADSWLASTDAAVSLRTDTNLTRIACVDVSLDGNHVTLACAAALGGGRYRVEVVAAWGSLGEARAALGYACAAHDFAALGWFPNGPGAAIGHEVRESARASTIGIFPHPGESLELAGTAVAEVCQGFAAMVAGREVGHPGDPLLNAHVAAAKRQQSGDTWRFMRRDSGHVDALWAAAGAVYLARKHQDIQYDVSNSYA
jgi:hypothetical protein